MRLLSLTFFLLMTLAGLAQETKLYDVEADASKQIAAAIKEANAQNKNVMIQAGGNWCSWCIKFNKFTIADAQIDSIIKASYVLVHLNYSKENKNEATFAIKLVSDCIPRIPPIWKMAREAMIEILFLNFYKLGRHGH